MKKPDGFKFGWKVVRLLDGGCFCSCFAPFGGIAAYAIDEPTVRKVGCGPLAVFKSSKAAAKFVREYQHNRKLEMLPCWYKPSKLKTAAFWCPSYYDNPARSDGKCWREIVPPSTAFADVVILKKG